MCRFGNLVFTRRVKNDKNREEIVMNMVLWSARHADA